MRAIRFVQTSDVHLRSDRPERRRALEQVFAVAEQRAADAVIIAGDLFDRFADAAHERAFVRERIEAAAPRTVLLVPGNHDLGNYKIGDDYGANARVLSTVPFASTRVGALEVIGLPYQHSRTAAECLSAVDSAPLETVLIAHGTLARGIAAAFAGEGEDGAYMPIFPADLERRCCYAALGHLHAGAHLMLEAPGRLYAYAGSPVATSRRELGRRSVLVVDVEPGAGVVARETVPLATPYFERVEAFCLPGAEREAVAELAQLALRARRPGARVLCRLDGITTGDEVALRDLASETLERAWSGVPASQGPPRPAESPDDDAASYPILELATRSYAALRHTPVVAEFIERLNASSAADPASDRKVLDRALQIGLHAFLEGLP